MGGATLQFNNELGIAPNTLKKTFRRNRNKDAGGLAGWIKKSKLFYKLIL